MPKRFLAWLGLALAVIVLDQASKHAIEAALHLGEAHSIIPGLFNLTLAYNPGAAFSFLANAGGWQKHFFTVLALGVSVFLVLQLKKHPEQTRSSLAFSLILGGALGNVIDRVLLGHVIDFIQVYYGRWYYPAFNIADSAICVGAALMVWESFASRKKDAA
ncbi:signal peptidase II [Andreprevotia lacus DSM 23236]|jgi:signal peptidase II|uniref:Lipoprotein signal peptidase n=1 Tax=Andreprevotia lacus DSM 23236 TaxID=1121001 RepID=A0A1W1XXE6_9NEIS|nr:signal peptidase II [Andreprevotia lacus]SMC28188.1 signal peptidase II [Andreprevotia lacus DSM 23236]